MFNELKKQISTCAVESGEQRMLDVETRLDYQEKEIIKLNEELLDYKLKNEILSGAVVRISQEMSDLSDCVERMEINTMKKSMVVTGFLGSNTKKKCAEEFEQFIKQKMNQTVKVVEVFFLTKQGTSLMVVTLDSLEDKLKIYRNV